MKLSKSKPSTPKAQPKKGSLNFNLGKKDKTTTNVDPETFSYTPKLPIVNTIPYSITQKYEVKGILRKAGFALIGLVGVLALGFAGAQTYQGMLNNQLATLEQEASGYKAEADALSVYTQYKNAIEGKRQALASSVQTDVNMGVIYADLSDTAASVNLELSDITITQAEDPNGIEVGACMNPDPFVENANIIGCITLESSSTDANAGKRYVEALGSLSDPKKYLNPFISSVTTDDEGTVRFSINVAFTNALYTNQYVSLQKSLAEILAPEGETEPAPAEETQPEATPQTKSLQLDTVLNEALPGATPEVAAQVNKIATASCSADDSQQELNKIKTILEPLLGGENNINAVMDSLNTQIALQCEGLKNG